MADELKAGTELGEYVLVSPLGEGGFASVWLAQHRYWPERRVAAKIIRDRDQVDQLKTEARCLAGLTHPNIAGAIGIDLDHDPPYLLVELHEGRTLRQVLAQDGPLPAERAKHVFSQIVAALAASHAHGIAHGDLKPENILVAEGDRVKVADFGMGRVKARQASILLSENLETSATAGGDARAIAGTIPYMAPEQQAGEVADTRTDVFTLGVLLHEMTAGARPQPGDELSGSLAGDTAWHSAFARCYARRDRRFADAGELRAAIFEAPPATASAAAASPLPAKPLDSTEAAALWTPEEIEKAMATEAECTLEQLRKDSFWVGARGLTCTAHVLHHNLGWTMARIGERYGLPARKIRSKLQSGVNGEVLKGAAEALAPLPLDLTRRFTSIERRLVLWLVVAIVSLVVALAAVGGAVYAATLGAPWSPVLGIVGLAIGIAGAATASMSYDEARAEVDGLVPSIDGRSEKEKLAKLAMRYDKPLVRRRAQALLDGSAVPEKPEPEKKKAKKVAPAPVVELAPITEEEPIVAPPRAPIIVPVAAPAAVPAPVVDLPPLVVKMAAPAPMPAEPEAPRRPPIVTAPAASPSSPQGVLRSDPRQMMEE